MSSTMICFRRACAALDTGNEGVCDFGTFHLGWNAELALGRVDRRIG